MANTTVAAENRVKQWERNYHREYVRANRFRRYMGTSMNSIIMLKEDLTKKPGDRINLMLTGALDKSGGANDGSTPLVGNEKALPNAGFGIDVSIVRDATVVNVEEEQASPIDIFNAGKVALKDLQMQYLRDDIITAMGSINGVAYASASEGQKDAWLATNSDRVQFGALASNNSGNDHSASLLNVDAVNDTLTSDLVSVLKRKAQNAVNVNAVGIRPFKYGEDEETFVMFAPSYAWRDLKKDLEQNHEQAMERGKSNPLWTGANTLYWDGVIIREIPEIPALGAVGAASARVEPVYLCGTQALGVAWAKRTKMTRRKEDDYEFQRGVGFMEMRGVDKILYGASGKQWGMVTGYVAAALDA